MNNYQFKSNPEFHVWDQVTYESINSKARFKQNRFFRTLPPDSSILDIGCGPAYNVKILKENGFNVLGIDLNEVSISRAKNAGLPVEKIDAVEAIKKYKTRYNVFNMMDFIEHVPLQVVVDILQEIKSVDKATVFISTPNLDSIMGFKFWFQMPTHVNAMHPYVIRKMLTNMGYTIEAEWSEYGKLPGKGWKLWLRKKILHYLFGTQSQLFLGGANICFIAKNNNN